MSIPTSAASVRLQVLAMGMVLLTAAAPCPAVQEGGERVLVTKVIDGDTLEVRGTQRPFRVRLDGIDAPERGQPFSQRARERLASLVFGKRVELIPTDVDRYGRLVARVVVGEDTDPSRVLVAEGMAWHYTVYSSDPVLAADENAARRARAGIWSIPGFRPSWRPEELQPSSPGARRLLPERVDPATFRCGTKSFCREMRSCAEARFHLEQCGLARLDGDGDGTPCEALCANP